MSSNRAATGLAPFQDIVINTDIDVVFQRWNARDGLSAQGYIPS